MAKMDMSIDAKIVFDASVTVIATTTLRDMEKRITDLLASSTRLVLENRNLSLMLARRNGIT